MDDETTRAILALQDPNQKATLRPNPTDEELHAARYRLEEIASLCEVIAAVGDADDLARAVRTARPPSMTRRTERAIFDRHERIEAEQRLKQLTSPSSATH